jgi:hypothetical protein
MSSTLHNTKWVSYYIEEQQKQIIAISHRHIISLAWRRDCLMWTSKTWAMSLISFLLSGISAHNISQVRLCFPCLFCWGVPTLALFKLVTYISLVCSFKHNCNMFWCVNESSGFFTLLRIYFDKYDKIWGREGEELRKGDVSHISFNARYHQGKPIETCCWCGPSSNLSEHSTRNS